MVQSMMLIFNEELGYLETNLIFQLFLLVAFGAWSYFSSGTYLNAPLVFIVSVYLWHSPFLTGHYFQLAEIFEWTGRHFTYGEEFVPRATGFVGLCMAAGVWGSMLGYSRTSGGAVRCMRISDSPTGLTRQGKQILWLAFVGYALLTLLYFVKEGSSAVSGDYLSLYTEHSDSLLYRVYQATKFYFSLLILAVFAFATSRRELWHAFAITLGVICIQVLLGSRSIPFINLIALGISINYFIRKISPLFLLAGLLLMSAVSFIIQYARVEGVLNSLNFDLANNEISFLHMFWEMGGVIRNVIRTMAFMGPDGFVYGQTFINSIVYILPKFFLDGLGFQPGILRPSEWLIEYSSDIPDGGGIGYSLVAESYYNFGIVGALIFLLIGWLVAAKYFRFVRTGDRFSMLHAMNIVIILSLHMRNDTEAYLRYILYGSLFIELLCRLSRKGEMATFSNSENRINKSEVSPSSDC